MGRILSRELDFELLPAGNPLLDSTADFKALTGVITESLGSCAPEDGWFFFFAGYGNVDGARGCLLPARGRVKGTVLDLDWLIEKSLESHAGRILIVLDAGPVGTILRRPDLAPRLDPTDRRSGAVQVLATTGPFAEGEERQFTLTRQLIEALDGQAGIHELDGSVRFTSLLTFLRGDERGPNEDVDGLESPRIVGQSIRLSRLGSLRGDFRFKPRWPRLPAELIQGLRQPEGDLECLVSLPGACSEEPAGLPRARRLTWNLPLAVRVLTRDLPQEPVESLRERLHQPVSTRGPELQRRLAGVLGEVGRLQCQQDLASSWEVEEAVSLRSRLLEGLLHLALREPDPEVRAAAGLALAQALVQAERDAFGPRLEKLRRDATWRLRLRVDQVAAQLRLLPRRFPLVLRIVLPRTILMLGRSRRWIVKHRWRRRFAIACFLLPAGAYLVLWPSHYLSTERLSRGLPSRDVVVRRGWPGFEVLPWIGDVTVVTGYSVEDLADSSAALKEQRIGSWLHWRSGMLAWGHELAAQLRPGESALAYWRIGDLEEALHKLERDVAAGHRESLASALTMARVDDAATGPVLDLLLRALESNDGAMRESAFQGLRTVQRERPEAAAKALAPLRHRLETAPDSEAPVLIDKVSALGGESAEGAAIRRAFALLKDGGPQLVRERLLQSVDRSLKERSQLAVLYLEDILHSLQQSPSGDVFLEWIGIAISADPRTGRRAFPVLHDLLREAASEHDRVALLGLLKLVLDRDASLVTDSASLLVSLTGDSQATVVLAAAEVVAGFSFPAEVRSPFIARLSELARYEPKNDLRRRAVDQLVALWQPADSATAVAALHEAVADEDSTVRSSAVEALVTLALDGRISQGLQPLWDDTLHDQDSWVRQEAAQGVVLLAQASDSHYETAAEEVMTRIGDFRQLELHAPSLARKFQLSTPLAAARFAERLLTAMSQEEPGGYYRYREVLEVVIQNQPETLTYLVPGLTAIFASPDGRSQLVWETVHSLQAPDLDLSPLLKRFMAQLRSGSVMERRAAALVLGDLLSDEPELAARSVGGLSRSMSDPDPEVAARVGVSLRAIALHHERLAGEATSLLVRGLGDEQPIVRATFARALSGVAEEGGSVPASLPGVVETVAQDRDTATRFYLARALRLWGRGHAAELLAVLPWLEDRLAREPEPLVQIELAAALGGISRGDAAVVERILPIFAAGLASGETPQAQSSISALEALAVADSVPSGRIIELLRQGSRTLPSLLQRLTIGALEAIGLAHPEGGENALEALEEILHEIRNRERGSPPAVLRDLDGPIENELDRSLWFPTVQSLRRLGEARPALATRILQVLEAGLEGDPRHVDFRSNSGRDTGELDAAQAWRVWVDLAERPAARDLELLWRKLDSYNSTHRLVAVELIGRLAATRPDLVPALEEGLEVRRQSRLPHRRMAATQGWENLEIQRKKGAGSGPYAR